MIQCIAWSLSSMHPQLKGLLPLLLSLNNICLILRKKRLATFCQTILRAHEKHFFAKELNCGQNVVCLFRRKAGPSAILSNQVCSPSSRYDPNWAKVSWGGIELVNYRATACRYALLIYEVAASCGSIAVFIFKAWQAHTRRFQLEVSPVWGLPNYKYPTSPFTILEL